MSQEPPFDAARAHRWFASQLNNHVWHWLEDSERDVSQASDIVHAAHASCHHWMNCGTAIHRARGEYLVSFAHAFMGSGQASLYFAQQSLDGLGHEPEGLSDWDLAFAADAVARAYNALSDSKEAERWRQEARRFGDLIADPQDKAIFDKWFVTEAPT